MHTHHGLGWEGWSAERGRKGEEKNKRIYMEGLATAARSITNGDGVRGGEQHIRKSMHIRYCAAHCTFQFTAVTI